RRARPRAVRRRRRRGSIARRARGPRLAGAAGGRGPARRIGPRAVATIVCPAVRNGKKPAREQGGRMNKKTETQRRVWFVTGTSSGFGNAVGAAVLEHGDRLAATARDRDSIA